MNRKPNGFLSSGPAALVRQRPFRRLVEPRQESRPQTAGRAPDAPLTFRSSHRVGPRDRRRRSPLKSLNGRLPSRRLAGFDLVLGYLADPVEDIRRQATSTVVALASLSEATEAQRSATAAALTAVASGDEDPATLAASVLSLALLGADVRTWLDHAALPVRTAAALAPSLRDDPAAHAVLLDSLARSQALDQSLPDGYPQLDGYPRFAVIAAVCDRIPDRAAALPSLLTALDLASTWTVDRDRAPILAYFFGPETLGTALTSPQRTFLEALLARDDLWDPTNGNAQGAFRRAALPYDREAVAEIVADGVLPTPPAT